MVYLASFPRIQDTILPAANHKFRIPTSLCI